MGTSRWAERALVAPLHFFLAIPGIAVFPIVILWLGLGEAAIVVTLAFEASLSVTLNTWAGVKAVDAALVNAGRALGASGHRLFRRVLVPAALPAIITGYRQGFSRAWRLLVAGEMLASVGTGVGFRIFEARAFLASDVMYAGVLVIGVLGVLVERLALRPLEILTVQRWGMLREL
jgi:ABC-type nitrate/sulfonate/bicarbonate transport system permease component